MTLNEDTLPNDSGLREGQETTVETKVLAGMARAAVFAVGETPKTTPFGERFVQRAFTGLKLGMIIAMSAVGLSLIYGTTGLVNFAHGELVTFGAVIAWYFNTSWGRHLNGLPNGSKWLPICSPCWPIAAVNVPTDYREVNAKWWLSVER